MLHSGPVTSFEILCPARLVYLTTVSRVFFFLRIFIIIIYLHIYHEYFSFYFFPSALSTIKAHRRSTQSSRWFSIFLSRHWPQVFGNCDFVRLSTFSYLRLSSGLLPSGFHFSASFVMSFDLRTCILS